MFLAVRSWPQEWSSTETLEIFDTKINHYMWSRAMFLAARFLPQEWSSSVALEIFGTKINHYCGVEGKYCEQILSDQPLF